MMTALLSKIGIPVLVFLAGGIGGLVLQQKLTPTIEIPQCPACSCPEPAVKMQNIEIEKMKGLKSFNYSPQFSGSISVAGVDSTALRRMIDKSLSEALSRYDVKRRRR